MAEEIRVVVKQIRGLSGISRDVISNIRALGLGRIGKSKEFVLNPAVRGMIQRVKHLVSVTRV